MRKFSVLFMFFVLLSTPCLADDSDQYDSDQYDGNQQNGSTTYTQGAGGRFDNNTGVYQQDVAGGHVDTSTGTFHQDVAGGSVNTQTGVFTPDN